MDASNFAELLKPFPLLQLFVGAAVFLAIIAVTLRGAKENRRDAHIVPAGHDPYGVAVTGNSILVQLSMIVDNTRRMSEEQIKTNARLAEMSDTHGREMDHLREVIKDSAKPSRRGG